jgi:hypothetical protein
MKDQSDFYEAITKISTICEANIKYECLPTLQKNLTVIEEQSKELGSWITRVEDTMRGLDKEKQYNSSSKELQHAIALDCQFSDSIIVEQKCPRIPHCSFDAISSMKDTVKAVNDNLRKINSLELMRLGIPDPASPPYDRLTHLKKYVEKAQADVADAEKEASIAEQNIKRMYRTEEEHPFSYAVNQSQVDFEYSKIFKANNVRRKAEELASAFKTIIEYYMDDAIQSTQNTCKKGIANG